MTRLIIPVVYHRKSHHESGDQESTHKIVQVEKHTHAIFFLTCKRLRSTYAKAESVEHPIELSSDLEHLYCRFAK